MSNIILSGYVSVTGNKNVGTLIGKNTGDIDGVSIIPCATITANINAGTIAGFNSGEIANSRVKGASVSAENYAGGIVGENTGDIKDSQVREMEVSAENYAGGISGINTGTIDSVEIANTSVGATYNYLGGVTGSNSQNGAIEGTYPTEMSWGYPKNCSGMFGGIYSASSTIDGMPSTQYESSYGLNTGYCTE